jgi:hypothetical protein
MKTRNYRIHALIILPLSLASLQIAAIESYWHPQIPLRPWGVPCIVLQVYSYWQNWTILNLYTIWLLALRVLFFEQKCQRFSCIRYTIEVGVLKCQNPIRTEKPIWDVQIWIWFNLIFWKNLNDPIWFKSDLTWNFMTYTQIKININFEKKNQQINEEYGLYGKLYSLLTVKNMDCMITK